MSDRRDAGQTDDDQDGDVLGQVRSWWLRLSHRGRSRLTVVPPRTWHILAVLAALLVVALVLRLVLPVAYRTEWTGLGASRSPVKSPKVLFDYYPSKTLWDWAQLLVVPAVLVVAGFLLNRAQQSREREIAEKNRAQDQEIAEKNRAQDQEIADDRQQDAALDTYLATMTTLLLDKELKKSAPRDEVRAVARSQTLTVLRRLNGVRKGAVVRFMYESELIFKGTPVVDLDGADLSGADLSHAILRDVNLRGATLATAVLTDATLAGACLDQANLSEADLVRADMASASLDGANLHAARLWSANLNQAVLGEVDRGSARLGTFTLDQIVVGGSSTGGANLSEANLSDATLARATLAGVILTGARLRGANLTGAIGTTPEQLAQAASLEGTIMPDGQKHS